SPAPPEAAPPPLDESPAAVLPGVPPAAAPADTTPRGRFGIDTLIPERREDAPASPPLSPDLQREVDEVAQRQADELRRAPGAAPPGMAPADAPANPGGPASTRLEISRAPSPTEARPIRAIPVPEE